MISAWLGPIKKEYYHKKWWHEECDHDYRRECTCILAVRRMRISSLNTQEKFSVIEVSMCTDIEVIKS